MNIGMVGVPLVGKSTLFRLLTHADLAPGKNRTGSGTALVPDSRIDYLVQAFKPRKVSYAQINLTDIPGLEPGRSAEFLAALHGVDALVVVVRAFEAAHVPTWNAGELRPLAEVRAVEEELMLTDWALVNTRMDRARTNKRGMQVPDNRALLERLAAALERSVPLRRQTLAAEERQALDGMSFMSNRPLIVVANTDDDSLRSGHFPGQAELATWCSEHNVPLVEVCAKLEMEIEELEPADRAAFLQDLGVAEVGLTRLARAAYAALGFISFFTVGEDEVKAWTVRQGTTARQAAGKIHSDIARGFIRAEVTAYADYVAHAGHQLRANGAVRLEGRDYLVQDGDIINFRFNV